MKKNLLLFAVYLLIDSINIQASPNSNNKPSQELAIEALELAFALKTTSEPLPQTLPRKSRNNSFLEPLEKEQKESSNSKPVESFQKSPEEPLRESAQQQESEIAKSKHVTFQDISLADKINFLQEHINNIENDSLSETKSYINKIIDLLNNGGSDTKTSNEILNNLQQLYKLFFTGLQLKKGLLNSNTMFLNINNAQLKVLNKIAILDIKNILALFWIQYIEKYNNNTVEISFIQHNKPEQKQSFSPLGWAYFTAHSGSDFSENHLLGNYSKPSIIAIFNRITEQAHVLQNTIENAAKKEDVNKADLLQKVTTELSSLYQQLFLKKQTNRHFLQLLPEFQDAFPTTEQGVFERPILPKELAAVLASLAEIWLKLINNKIIAKDETAALTYPEIIDAIKKLDIKISSMNWMHLTASAGYIKPSKNTIYEELVKEPSFWESYKAWIVSLPKTGRGMFNKFSAWAKKSL